jgi:hypothetical protein
MPDPAARSPAVIEALAHLTLRARAQDPTMSATVIPMSFPTRSGLGETDRDLLTAGLCLSARLPNPEAHFEDVLLELAQRRYKGLSLEETLLRAAQANGYPHTSIRADYGGAFKAAFSTSQLGGTLANVATKFLLEGFSRVEQPWREITAIRPVNDFKPVESYRLGMNARYEKVAPGGALTHGRMGEELFTNQADTYGKMLSIPRQDILNDDLGALTETPRLLGRGAAQNLNEVFWRAFCDNAGFFTAANGCRLDGADTALSIDGLTRAETAFNLKTEADGLPLAIDAGILLVPSALGAPASALMNSLEIRAHAGDAYPTANPHTGKFRLVKSAWLGSPVIPGADDRAWYLLADPQVLPVIEVAFLNGQEQPTIEEAQADFSVLGIQMRGFHDFGVRKQDPRGGIKMMGA